MIKNRYKIKFVYKLNWDSNQSTYAIFNVAIFVKKNLEIILYTII